MINLKTALWIGGGLAAAGALLYGGKKATQLVDLKDKLSVIPSLPRIHKVSAGNIIVMIDSTKVVNQSSLAVPLDQLFTTISNNGNDLFKQTSPIKQTTIQPYQSTTLGPVELTLPLLTAGKSLLDLLKGQSGTVLDVITRVTAMGFEFPVKQQIDIASAIKGSSSLFDLF